MISATQRDRIEGYIQSAADEGATLAIDGRRPADMATGFYVGPTLVTECDPSMTVVREEIFGPVVVVVPFDGDDEVGLAVANDSEFGLYSYVFSADTSRAYSLAQRIRSGVVGINTAQIHPEAPFGGFKRSGVGRDRGDVRPARLHRDAVHCLVAASWPACGCSTCRCSARARSAGTSSTSGPT